jgi:hypothetical protein
MPALTHNRVKNGFNGYATKVVTVVGGVAASSPASTQPLKYNGGQQPKRNFKAKYNAQINAPNALTNSIGSSFTTKRANARRAGDPNRKLLGLPEVSWGAPGQASKTRQVQRAPSRFKTPWHKGPGSIFTITVGKCHSSTCFNYVTPADYTAFGVQRGPSQIQNYGFGSVSPPDPTNLFALVLASTPSEIDFRQFIVVIIPGWPPALSTTLHNIKITNVTNSQSQEFEIAVNTAGSGTITSPSLQKWDDGNYLWELNDIVTVEILN